jgi:hypothetical protein
MAPVWHAPSRVEIRRPTRPNLGSVTDEEELPAFDTGPGPPRAAFLIAYAAVVLAGLFGGAIGYGLVNASRGSTSGGKAVGAIVGAVVAAVGVGIVAVLALRAMAEWRRPPGSGANDRPLR